MHDVQHVLGVQRSRSRFFVTCRSLKQAGAPIPASVGARERLYIQQHSTTGAFQALTQLQRRRRNVYTSDSSSGKPKEVKLVSRKRSDHVLLSAMRCVFQAFSTASTTLRTAIADATLKRCSSFVTGACSKKLTQLPAILHKRCSAPFSPSSFSSDRCDAIAAMATHCLRGMCEDGKS